jgi:hypothetical protein
VKTTFDLVNIIVSILKGNTALMSTINGGVYKQRPAGSTKEDIVINSLPVNNLQMQSGLVNVNIHIPTIAVTIDGTVDHQLNAARFKEVTDMVIALLDDVWAQDYNLGVQQQNLIKEQNGTEYYNNIRIEFNIINLN